MKIIYTLMVFAGLSASLNAQSIDKSNRPFIKKTIPFTYLPNAERMSSPDTTGIVNYYDFLPQFGGLPSTPVLYTYTGGGFVYGNNADTLNVCAQGYLNVLNIPVRILGVLLGVKAKQSDAGSSPTSKIIVKAWGISPNKAFNTDSSGIFNNTILNWAGPATANNAPDASADILFTDIDTLDFTYAAFAVPPVYTGDFAVGVDFSTLAPGDTAGLMSDGPGSAIELDYAYHLYHNQWIVSDQLFSNAASPDFGSGQLNNDIAIWAVVDEPQCFSHYTTVYDTLLNTFNLNINPFTTTIATGYHWDFGDGSTSALANPTHMYAVDSLYNVCLKIYTAAGDSCEYCHMIGFDPSGNVIRTPGFTLHVISPATVSVEDFPNENTINISPNP